MSQLTTYQSKMDRQYDDWESRGFPHIDMSVDTVESSIEGHSLASVRKDLPAWELRGEVLESETNNQVTGKGLFAGPTDLQFCDTRVLS